MTIASVRRIFPSLVRQAEREMGLRFAKKPRLHLCKGGNPRGLLYTNGKHRILITKRMARTNEEASKSCILHELREVLLVHHNPHFSVSHAHLFVVQYETLRDAVVFHNYRGRRKVKV